MRASAGNLFFFQDLGMDVAVARHLTHFKRRRVSGYSGVIVRHAHSYNGMSTALL